MIPEGENRLNGNGNGKRKNLIFPHFRVNGLGVFTKPVCCENGSLLNNSRAAAPATGAGHRQLSFWGAELAKATLPPSNSG